MAAVAVLKNRKIAISQQRFDRSPRNLAWWRTLALFTLPPLTLPPFENPRWRRPPCWKIEKLPYLSNGLADCREIWRIDAFWPSWPFPPLKFPPFDNARWRRVPSSKIEKIVMSQQRFDRSMRSLARWCSLAVLNLPAPEISTFLKCKMAAAAILKNRKMALSQQQFGRLPRTLARWRILTYLTLSTPKFPPDLDCPRLRRSPSWKIAKWRNLSNGLMDHHEIWHGDAVWPSWAFDR